MTRRKTGRPRTLKTLGSTVRALFQGNLTDEELSKLIDGLTAQASIVVHDGKVAYKLPE